MGASGSLILFNGREFINIITDADAPVVEIMLGVCDHIKKFDGCKKSSSIIPKPCHTVTHYNPITIMPPKRKATTTAAKSKKKVIVAAAAAAALDTDEESDVEDEDTQRVELVKVGKIK